MFLADQLIKEIAEGSRHFFVPESVHHRVQGTVTIVTELDELQEPIGPQGGGEVRRVVSGNYCNNKERQPSDHEQPCDGCHGYR